MANENTFKVVIRRQSGDIETISDVISVSNRDNEFWLKIKNKSNPIRMSNEHTIIAIVSSSAEGTDDDITDNEVTVGHIIEFERILNRYTGDCITKEKGRVIDKTDDELKIQLFPHNNPDHIREHKVSNIIGY